MDVGAIAWSLVKMGQVYTGYLWENTHALTLQFLPILQETIFDKFNFWNLTSLTINGGAIYDKLYAGKQTKMIKTEGGHGTDLKVADTLGFEVLK